MGIRLEAGSDQYLIFRVETIPGLGTKLNFLTDKGTWTRRRELARKGSLSRMKSIVSKLKAVHPDLILEQCRE